MKGKIRVRVMATNGQTSQWLLEATVEYQHFYISSDGYYAITETDGTIHYYPIKFTILDRLP
jgi:flagellar basal body rod protein FlgG